MNIVILGAGSIGAHVATILSKEQHNVVLVDLDGRRLDELAAKMDVGVQKGNATDLSGGSLQNLRGHLRR